MKKIKILLLILIVLFAFSSCAKLGFLFPPTITTAEILTNISSPVWNWNKVPGVDSYEYKLVSPGVLEGSVVWIAVEGGNVDEMTLPANLFTKEGDYTIYIRGVSFDDEFPYTEVTSTKITIDRTGPQKPVATGLIVTNNSLPSWNWNAVDDAVGYSVAYFESGPWTELMGNVLTYTASSSLSEGEHSFYVRAVDEAGNWSELSAGIKTIVDLSGFLAPDITMSTPGVAVIENDILIKKIVTTAKPTWIWAMPSLPDSPEFDLDGDGDVDADDYNAYYNNHTKFRYQLNSQKESTWIEIGAGELAFTPSIDLPEGITTLYLQAGETISAGNYNWSSSSVAIYEIDSIIPETPVITGISSLFVGDVLSWSWIVPSEAVFNRVALVGASSIPADLQDKLTAALVQNGGEDDWPSDVLDYTYEGEALPVGNYSLLVQCFDAVGNNSVATSFEFVIESAAAIAPVVTSVSDTPTNDSTPTWSWLAVLGSTDYRYQLDGEVNGNWVIVDSSTLEFTPSALNYLSHATHTLYVQSSKDGGSIWSNSGSSVINVDLEAPNAPTINGDAVSGSLRPEWSWIAGTGGTEAFRFRLGHALGTGSHEFEGALPAWMQCDSSVNKYIPSSNLGVSSIDDQTQNYYRFEVQARDIVGNWCEATSFITQIRTDKPTAPVFDVEPVLTFGKTTNRDPSWSWHDIGGIETPLYRYKLDSAAWSPNDTGDGTVVHDVSSLTEGAHDFYVQVFNGTLWSTSARSSLIIDLTGPIAVNVVGISVPTSNRRPTWYWSVPVESEVVDGFRWSYDDSTWTEVGLTPISFSPSSDLGADDASTDVTLYVQSKDVLGNWSPSDSYSITIDTRTLDAPVIAGDVLCAPSVPGTDSTPTWTWDAVTDAVLYRYSLNGDSNNGPWSETSNLTYSSALPLNGANTLYVQAKSGTGLWSTSGSFITTVDFISPPVPIVLSGAPKTSDQTPSWEWDKSPLPSAAGYSYKLESDGAGFSFDWTIESMDQTYTPSSDLDEDIYTLFVKAVDDNDNWSEIGQYQVEVSLGSGNASLPPVVYLISASERSLSAAIRIEWMVNDKAETYNIYRITQAQFDAGGTDLEGILVYTNTVDNFADAANGNKYYYDETVGDSSNYFYRVAAENEEGEGKKSYLIKSDTTTVDTSRGSLFGKINVVAAVPSFSVPVGFSLNWIGITNSNSYALLRTGPYAVAQNSAALESVSWDYLNSSELWTASGSEDFEDMHNIDITSYSDRSGIAENDFFYYKIMAANESARDNNDYQNENVVTGDYFVSTSQPFGGQLAMPASINGWLTVSDNDPSCSGDIKLTINVPPEYNAANYDFVIERTYRWGGDGPNGGYQGANATLNTDNSMTKDWSSHSDLTNPNPATTSWEKTVALEYDTSGLAFAGGSSLTVYDTLYDVNTTNGLDPAAQKLIAVRLKGYSNGGTVVPAWYERTQASIDGPSTFGAAPDGDDPWSIVVDDRDNSPSEHEWHYMKWDWVFRKAIAHYSNDYHQVNIEELSRADYVLKAYPAGASSPEVVSSVTYGWPALTAREFLFLLAFIRDVGFGHLPLTYADEVEEQGIGADTSDLTGDGRVEGQICAHDNGLKLTSPISIESHIYATGGPNGGIKDFNDVELIFDWNPFKMYIGDSHSLKGETITVKTLKYNGTLSFDGNLLGGTVYHGSNNLTFTINDGVSYSGNIANYYSSSPDPTLGSSYIISEYQNDGWTWSRARSMNASNWFERYTSINWQDPVGNHAYPGF